MFWGLVSLVGHAIVVCEAVAPKVLIAIHLFTQARLEFPAMSKGRLIVGENSLFPDKKKSPPTYVPYLDA